VKLPNQLSGGIHADGRVVCVGEAPETAARAMVLIHGRGATPESILALVDELPDDLGFAFVAPGASENTSHPRSWYPRSFLAPVEDNEPDLSSALAKIDTTVAELQRFGIGPSSIMLLGFSQGACLALEYAARRARRWGGVAALTGGLIGDHVVARDDAGTLDGTPVFLGCSDRDPHVPLSRVNESEAVLRGMGARVEKRIYPGLPHIVVRDELDWVDSAMRRVAGRLPHHEAVAAADGG
jgi:predicted esterase